MFEQYNKCKPTVKAINELSLVWLETPLAIISKKIKYS